MISEVHLEDCYWVCFNIHDLRPTRGQSLASLSPNLKGLHSGDAGWDSSCLLLSGFPPESSDLGFCDMINQWQGVS